MLDLEVVFNVVLLLHVEVVFSVVLLLHLKFFFNVVLLLHVDVRRIFLKKNLNASSTF